MLKYNGDDMIQGDIEITTRVGLLTKLRDHLAAAIEISNTLDLDSPLVESELEFRLRFVNTMLSMENSIK